MIINIVMAVLLALITVVIYMYIAMMELLKSIKTLKDKQGSLYVLAQRNRLLIEKINDRLKKQIEDKK